MRIGPDAPGEKPIELDMEFSEQGGEGPTPYEVLLHAALVGDSSRFTRQDGVEETWRSCSRCSTTRRRPRYAPVLGPGGGATRSPARPAGTGPGSS
jgi:glucose-6-phosphate 1-dehydrogenase